MLAYKSKTLVKGRYMSATAHEKSRRLFEGGGANVCTNKMMLVKIKQYISGGDADRGNTRTHPEHDG